MEKSDSLLVDLLSYILMIAIIVTVLLMVLAVGFSSANIVVSSFNSMKSNYTGQVYCDEAE
jgi:hypothetical protein